MKSKLHPTRNDLSEMIRREMIDLLNQNLADVLDFGLQSKQAHWNVKGPHFIALHELFDQIAEEVEKFSDDIAERAVALGGSARGTVQIIATHSRLPMYPVNAISGKAHIEALSRGLATVGAAVRAATETASKAGDADTADLFTGISRGVDKLLWMVEAHVQSRD
ncbi:MAG: DNA starvation/stationary phase protection protein Dps [Verrucomicrobiales bacterium]|nr:DNA starvation/stationary phase protection protein Dps [Verrucomicrobiales bacterium]